MPAPSRRSPRASQRTAPASARSGRAPAPAAAPSEPIEEVAPISVDLEPGAPVTDLGADDAAPAAPVTDDAASARSSRRGAAASGRGRRGASSRPAAAVSARPKRELTDEEKAARRAALKSGLLISAGVLGMVIAIVAVVLLTRTPKEIIEAQHAFENVSAIAKQADDAYKNRLPVEARKFSDEAIKAIQLSNPLGNGEPQVNPDKVVSVKWALAANALLADLEELNKKIDLLKLVIMGEDNFKALNDRLGTISDETKCSDADLDALEKDMMSFCDNPEKIGGARDDNAIKRHQANVTTMKQRQVDMIQAQRKHRLDRVTTMPERETADQVAGLISGEYFGKALALVEEQTAKFPKANFTKTKDHIINAHAEAWKGAEAKLKNKLADAVAAGTTLADRQSATEEAKARVAKIVNDWGMPESTQKANDLLAQFPPL